MFKGVKEKTHKNNIYTILYTMDLSNETLEKTNDIININNIIKTHTNKIEGCCLYQHQSNFLQFKEGNRYDNKLI